MKIVRIALVIAFVLGCASKGSDVGRASNERKVETGHTKSALGSSQPPPAVLSPMKPVYVTRPGDPFVLLVSAECESGNPDSTTFEIVQPAPGFVHLSGTGCAGPSGFTLGVISVSPGNDDLGTHFVQVIARPCGGGGPATTFVLRIKVKRS